MRVLITDLTLATRSGSELFTRDLPLALRRRGHRPSVYTRDPGSVQRRSGAPASTWSRISRRSPSLPS